MLARVGALRAPPLDHVALRRMDGERMTFADDSFDKVVAMYVVSVAPDPVRLVDDAPGVQAGRRTVHRQSLPSSAHRRRRPRAPDRAAVAARGLPPDFCLDTFTRDTGLAVVERTPVNLFGYWTLLRARNNKASVDTGAPKRAGSERAPAVRRWRIVLVPVLVLMGGANGLNPALAGEPDPETSVSVFCANRWRSGCSGGRRAMPTPDAWPASAISSASASRPVTAGAWAATGCGSPLPRAICWWRRATPCWPIRYWVNCSTSGSWTSTSMSTTTAAMVCPKETAG